MIPKIIHYCWFGGKEKPSDFERLFQSWQKFFPGWKFIEWNENNFDINYCNYSKEAYLTGNFAHVSDVCRILALHKYGGVYLDTDVEVLKHFDPFLPLDSFMSFERDFVGTAVMATVPGSEWTSSFLKYYRTRHFINMWGHVQRTPNTKILTREILPNLKFQYWPTIFPIDFFIADEDAEGKKVITSNTHAVHYYFASWRKKKTLSERISNILKGLNIRYLG